MNKLTLSVLLSATILSACDLAPNFKLPNMHVPKMFKEADALPADKEGQWQAAEPLEKEHRGEWWRIFGDDKLNDLEKQAIAANPELQGAAARVKEARAVARANPTSFLPDLSIGTNAVRAKPSAASLAAFGVPAAATKPYTLFQGEGDLSYEVDLFQRVANTHEAYEKDADAQQATYRSVLLALQADVAEQYYMLRELDSESVILRDALNIRTEAARIMQKRFDMGDVADQDRAQTASQLASANADLIAALRQRTNTEHAMAILLGKLPSEFSFAESPLTGVPPAIPPGLPSALLTRRPDISNAVSAMKAANARIGAARAAFFPSLNLSVTGSTVAGAVDDLFKWSTRSWALGQLAGNALTLPVFDNGVNSANLDVAKSQYAEALANYRQQVLTGFKDVEDNLSDQKQLAEQSKQQDIAAKEASRTTHLSHLRYDAGEANYFEVADNERVSLAAERLASQVRGQRFTTTITLIRALGGGWDMTAKPASANPPIVLIAPKEIPDAPATMPTAVKPQPFYY